MIPEEIIAEVLSRTDIVSFVGRHVTLKKAGTLHKGLCPFHEEKTPSFTVSSTRNTYHCFGCGAHGNAIRFLMEIGARSFPEAVRELAGECGVEVPESRRESPDEREARQRKKTLDRRLLDLQDKLTTFFSDQLFGPRGLQAQRYLQNRGIDPQTAQAFRLGWCPADRGVFAEFIANHEIELDDLALLGVLLPPDAGWSHNDGLGRGYLRFKERLMFPVVDFRGEVTGFSARTLSASKKIAKYVNSPETPVFTKGSQLYGAYTARTAARRESRVILVEGNVDVIALWQNGLEGTVAAMGTALTPEQVRLVKRLSSHVVCVMDGDEAGIKAAFTSLIPFLESGIQPRAVMLPDGEDPDSLLRTSGIDHLSSLLDRAPPLLDLLIEKATNEYPNDAPGRLQALRKVAPAVAQLTDPLAVDMYSDRLANDLGISMSVVEGALREAKSQGKPSSPKRGADNRTQFRPSPKRSNPPEATMAFREDYTGAIQQANPNEIITKFDSLRVPGYVSELFVFIMQYPNLVARMCETNRDKLLTQTHLAGFVCTLNEEVRRGKLPNMDRILSEIERPDVVAFLRTCQSKTPVLDPDAATAAFEDAMVRLERASYESQVKSLNQEISKVYATEPEKCAELRKKLLNVKSQLLALSDSGRSPNTEGES